MKLCTPITTKQIYKRVINIPVSHKIAGLLVNTRVEQSYPFHCIPPSSLDKKGLSNDSHRFIGITSLVKSKAEPGIVGLIWRITKLLTEYNMKGGFVRLKFIAFYFGAPSLMCAPKASHGFMLYSGARLSDRHPQVVCLQPSYQQTDDDQSHHRQTCADIYSANIPSFSCTPWPY